MEGGKGNNKNGYFRIIEKEIKKRTIPVKKENKGIPEHYGKEKQSGRKTH